MLIRWRLQRSRLVRSFVFPRSFVFLPFLRFAILYSQKVCREGCTSPFCFRFFTCLFLSLLFFIHDGHHDFASGVNPRFSFYSFSSRGKGGVGELLSRVDSSLTSQIRRSIYFYFNLYWVDQNEVSPARTLSITIVLGSLSGRQQRSSFHSLCAASCFLDSKEAAASPSQKKKRERFSHQLCIQTETIAAAKEDSLLFRPAPSHRLSSHTYPAPYN